MIKWDIFVFLSSQDTCKVISVYIGREDVNSTFALKTKNYLVDEKMQCDESLFAKLSSSTLTRPSS